MSQRWEFHDPPTIGDDIELRNLLIDIKGRALPGKVKVLRKWITQTAPAAEAEIRVDVGHLFDGTSVPADVYADSSDNAQDKAAGTGARVASILVNDADDEPVEITVDLNGTTPVKHGHTSKVKRVNDLRVSTWGSGGRPVGTIQCINQADNEVYAKLAATANHSINARFYVPTGWKCIVGKAKAKFTTAPHANGIIATAGVNGRWLFDKGDGDLGIDKNIEARFHLSAYQSWMDITPPARVIDGAAGAYISLTHQATDTDLTTHFASYDISLIMWKEA
jgi:hypothetical protein